MINDFEEIIKKIKSNLNKDLLNEGNFPAMQLNNLSDDSSGDNLSEEKQNFFKMILNFSVNVIYFIYLFKNFDTLRENIKKETIKVVDNLNTSKIMLMNSIPPELLKTKMSIICEHLSKRSELEKNNAEACDDIVNEDDIQRNCK